MEEEYNLSDWEGSLSMEEVCYESDDTTSSDFIVIDSNKSNELNSDDSDQLFIFINNKINTETSQGTKIQCDLLSAQTTRDKKVQKKSFAEVVSLLPPPPPPLPKSCLSRKLNLKGISSKKPKTYHLNAIETPASTACFKSMVDEHNGHQTVIDTIIEEIKEFEPIIPQNNFDKEEEIESTLQENDDSKALESLTSSLNSQYSLLQNVQDITDNNLIKTPQPVLAELSDEPLDNTIVKDFQSFLQEQSTFCFKHEDELQISPKIWSTIVSPKYLLDIICFQSNDNTNETDVERHLVSAAILILFMGFSLITSSYFVFDENKYQGKVNGNFYKASPYYSSSLNDPHQGWVMSPKVPFCRNNATFQNDSKVYYWKKMKDLLNFRLLNTMLLLDYNSGRYKGPLGDNLSNINYAKLYRLIGHQRNNLRSPSPAKEGPRFGHYECISGQPKWLKDRVLDSTFYRERNSIFQKPSGPISRYQPSSLVGKHGWDFAFVQPPSLSLVVNYNGDANYNGTFTQKNKSTKRVFNATAEPKGNLAQPLLITQYLTPLPISSTLYNRNVINAISRSLVPPNPRQQTLPGTNNSSTDHPFPTAKNGTNFVIVGEFADFKTNLGKLGRSNRSSMLAFKASGVSKNALAKLPAGLSVEVEGKKLAKSTKSTALILFGALAFPKTKQGDAKCNFNRTPGSPSPTLNYKKINGFYVNHCRTWDFDDPFKGKRNKGLLTFALHSVPSPLYPARRSRRASCRNKSNAIVGRNSSGRAPRMIPKCWNNIGHLLKSLNLSRAYYDYSTVDQNNASYTKRNLTTSGRKLAMLPKVERCLAMTRFIITHPPTHFGKDSMKRENKVDFLGLDYASKKRSFILFNLVRTCAKTLGPMRKIKFTERNSRKRNSGMGKRYQAKCMIPSSRCPASQSEKDRSHINFTPLNDYPLIDYHANKNNWFFKKAWARRLGRKRGRLELAATKGGVKPSSRGKKALPEREKMPPCRGGVNSCPGKYSKPSIENDGLWERNRRRGRCLEREEARAESLDLSNQPLKPRPQLRARARAAHRACGF